ncbi:MAG: D-alanyl-D-alanine carboxypeptidase/D-alanyl-D-alanine-endopeptidase (penicillin-binding protein 4) [Kiritimatiellia bacterium]|jgi:D-alanyl-D-alanine carboxypeptidase/D-alanyl-D-alanine-endopeptidase (penicillin-binding protein 4)
MRLQSELVWLPNTAYTAVPSAVVLATPPLPPAHTMVYTNHALVIAVLLAWIVLTVPAAIAVDQSADQTATPASQDSAPPVQSVVAAVPKRVDFDVALAPIAKDRLFRVAKTALVVVDVLTGETVYERKANQQLVPASTMKVLTAASALQVLGPAYRFTTDVYVDGEVDQAGVLDGNLYVQGHGDPTLVVERLWKLVYDLRIRGIKEVRGDVVFDEGYFDTAYQLPGWDKKKDLRDGPSYFAYTSALSLNYNTAAVVVGPGAEVGQKARVFIETSAQDYVQVVNEAVTGAAGTARWVEMEREVTADKVIFKVSGTVPSDDEVKIYYRSVVDPTAHFIAAWKDMEAVHGIKVEGKHRRGTVPPGADLAYTHRSVPITAILMDMNKYSNNFIAEHVLKAVGAEAYGAPGTTEKGVRYVQEYLKTLKVDPSHHHLVNGSGLSRSATLRASVLTAVMVDMANNQAVGGEFRTTLAIAGLDGTLWARLKDQPSKVRGKTGTIDGVHCLTGYVRAGDGRDYAFAFLVNDLRGGTSQAKRLHDRFLRRMFNVGDL